MSCLLCLSIDSRTEGIGTVVILDVHPAFTSIIIFAGWAVKTFVANSVSRWVGDETTGEAWRAYSIP